MLSQLVLLVATANHLLFLGVVSESRQVICVIGCKSLYLKKTLPEVHVSVRVERFVSHG